MNQDIDLKTAREQLIALREELEALADTGAEAAAVVHLDQSRVGRLSRMDAMQAQAMAKAAVARRADMLRKIAAALRRIDEGGYGECVECGEAINPKRLQIDPTTALCIGCASAGET